MPHRVWVPGPYMNTALQSLRIPHDRGSSALALLGAPMLSGSVPLPPALGGFDSGVLHLIPNDSPWFGTQVDQVFCHLRVSWAVNAGVRQTGVFCALIWLGVACPP